MVDPCEDSDSSCGGGRSGELMVIDDWATSRLREEVRLGLDAAMGEDEREEVAAVVVLDVDGDADVKADAGPEVEAERVSLRGMTICGQGPADWDAELNWHSYLPVCLSVGLSVCLCVCCSNKTPGVCKTNPRLIRPG